MSSKAAAAWTRHSAVMPHSAVKQNAPLSLIDVNEEVKSLEAHPVPSRVVLLTRLGLQFTVQILDKSNPVVDWETHDVDQIVRVEMGMLIVRKREGVTKVTLHEGEVAVIAYGNEHRLEALGDGPTIISSIYLGTVH